ncbi:hypothetical protein TNCV_1675821 [Trichonephila clavipes]|nr:hypothetical protein TNCV_1675821 [Trichonephila clavipes]
MVSVRIKYTTLEAKITPDDLQMHSNTPSETQPCENSPNPRWVFCNRLPPGEAISSSTRPKSEGKQWKELKVDLYRAVTVQGGIEK